MTMHVEKGMRISSILSLTHLATILTLWKKNRERNIMKCCPLNNQYQNCVYIKTLTILSLHTTIHKPFSIDMTTRCRIHLQLKQGWWTNLFSRFRPRILLSHHQNTPNMMYNDHQNCSAAEAWLSVAQNSLNPAAKLLGFLLIDQKWREQLIKNQYDTRWSNPSDCQWRIFWDCTDKRLKTHHFMLVPSTMSPVFSIAPWLTGLPTFHEWVQRKSFFFR